MAGETEMPMAPHPQRIATLRLDGHSMLEAYHIARQEAVLRALDHAQSLDEVKAIVRELVLHTRFNNGARG